MGSMFADYLRGGRTATGQRRLPPDIREMQALAQTLSMGRPGMAFRADPAGEGLIRTSPGVFGGQRRMPAPGGSSPRHIGGPGFWWPWLQGLLPEPVRPRYSKVGGPAARPPTWTRGHNQAPPAAAPALTTTPFQPDAAPYQTEPLGQRPAPPFWATPSWEAPVAPWMPKTLH